MSARAVETTIAAPFAEVWRALRDPAEIRRWHGWDFDGLDEEIEVIYGSADADRSAGTIAIDDGSRFELEDRGAATLLRVTMPAPERDWDEHYDDIREGWASFVHQLRFALEHHPGEERRTLHVDGAPAIRVASAEPGEPYRVDDLSGRVLFRTAHQVGLTVDAYGPGLVIAHTKPGGGGMTIVTTYGLDADAFASVERRWRS